MNSLIIRVVLLVDDQYDFNTPLRHPTFRFLPLSSKVGHLLYAHFEERSPSSEVNLQIRIPLKAQTLDSMLRKSRRGMMKNSPLVLGFCHVVQNEIDRPKSVLLSDSVILL